MDTPTRERIEALEARVKELATEVAELRKVVGAVSMPQQSFRDIKQQLPLNSGAETLTDAG